MVNVMALDEQVSTIRCCSEFVSESQGQNLAMTVLYALDAQLEPSCSSCFLSLNLLKSDEVTTHLSPSTRTGPHNIHASQVEELKKSVSARLKKAEGKYQDVEALENGATLNPAS